MSWLDVDLSALVRNARRFAAAVRVPLMPMIKANGYGLGAVPVARALEAVGPWGFGVGTVEEVRVLRDAGLEQRVVAFVPFYPELIDRYLATDARPVIGSIAALDAWLAATEKPFHLEIDTGMGRSGIPWHDDAGIAAALERLAAEPRFEGIFTHFSSAELAPDVTERQWGRFEAVLRALASRPPLVHAANSAAGQWGPRYAADLARPGIFLYGGRAGALVPEPVATLRAPVHAVRPIRAGDPVSYGETDRARFDGEVVTLGIGYADGLPRSLSGRGLVGLGAATYPIAGRVTMDMTMVVAPTGAVSVGEIGTLFGGAVALDQQADLAGTVSYELLTAVGPRVVRRYGD